MRELHKSTPYNAMVGVRAMLLKLEAAAWKRDQLGGKQNGQKLWENLAKAAYQKHMAK